MPNLITRSDRTPNIDDYVYVSDLTGTFDGRVPVSAVTEIPVTTQTIYLSASETATQIQDKINSVGRFIPLNNVLTFQFLNGTYTLNDQLLFQGFYGGGQVNIYGDTSQTAGLHTGQNVHLNFNNNSRGVYCIHNTCFINVSQIKATCQDGNICFVFQRPGNGDIRYCYAINTGKTSSGSRGIQSFDDYNLYVLNNYVDGNYYGIACFDGGRIVSNDNDDTGTQPNYGLRCATAASIGKIDATQPTGSIANELVNVGGIIR